MAQTQSTTTCKCPAHRDPSDPLDHETYVRLYCALTRYHAEMGGFSVAEVKRLLFVRWNARRLDGDN